MESSWERVAVEIVSEVGYAEGGLLKSGAGGAWKHPFAGYEFWTCGWCEEYLIAGGPVEVKSSVKYALR